MTSQLTFNDLEVTVASTPKEANLIFVHSKVPLQRLFAARKVSTPNEFDDPLGICSMLARDSEWVIREAIATQLGTLCSKYRNKEDENSTILSILLMLCRDSNPQVRTCASQSLALIHHPTRLSTWMGLCREKDPRVRCTGCESIGTALRLASLDAQATSTLLCELAFLAKEDESFKVRKLAVQNLVGSANKLNSSFALSLCFEALQFLVKDPAWPVRIAVAELLPFVPKHVNATSLLMDLIEQDANSLVRASGRKSLPWLLSQISTTNANSFTHLAKMGTSTNEEHRFLFAFYFPGVLKHNPSNWDQLKAIYFDLCNDISGRIRRSLAHSIHALPYSEDLLPTFFSFLNDMDVKDEVKLGALRSAGRFLTNLPSSLQLNGFERVMDTLREMNSTGEANFAVSRDGRLALAQDLPLFAKLNIHRKQFADLFFTLALDVAQAVRELAVKQVVGVVDDLDDDVWNAIVSWSKDTAHFSKRQLFCIASQCCKTRQRARFETTFRPLLLTMHNDPVSHVKDLVNELLLV